MPSDTSLSHEEDSDLLKRIGNAARPELELIKKYKDLSLKAVSEQRKASLDERIKEPTEGAIIPVELLRFEVEKDESGKKVYKPYPISINGVLSSPEPTLWLGNFGAGKSTAAIGLTEMLNSTSQYIAVFVTANEINKGLHNNLPRGKTEQSEKFVLDFLSRNVLSLPERLRGEYKFVFVIDAFDEILNYRSNLMHAIRDTDQLRKYGKVIVTSRFAGFNEYENLGFTTLQLDPQAVIKNIDRYLALRTSKADRREKFKEFLMRQDEGVKTNYLLVYFLTDIYNIRPQELGDLKGIMSEGDVLIKGIETALYDHKLGKRSGMKQEPREYPGQPKEEAEALWKEYEAERAKALAPWMDFLQRVAAYMTVHDLKTLDRKGIEEVHGGWTLAKHLAQLKGM